jgi:hypothetical protein
VAVWEPATAQLLEPERQPSQRAVRRALETAMRSVVVAVDACKPTSENPDVGHPALWRHGGGVLRDWVLSRGIWLMVSVGVVRSVEGWVGGWSRQEPMG